MLEGKASSSLRANIEFIANIHLPKMGRQTAVFNKDDEEIQNISMWRCDAVGAMQMPVLLIETELQELTRLEIRNLRGL